MKDNSDVCLTIVIPVFNGEKYIAETVEHILMTATVHIEVLLIDDGSADGSAQLCDELSQRDKRVKCIHIYNSGIAAARNKGIEQAQGKYICFCDQDDEMVISVYEHLVYEMIKKSATMGMCATGRHINGQKSIYEYTQNAYYEHDEVLHHVLFHILFRGYDYPFVKGNNYLYGTVWKCVFDTEFIRNNNIEFKSFVNYEDDWIFVTHALSLTENIVVTHEIGYYWNINMQSKSHGKEYISEIIHKIDEQDAYVYKYLTDRGISVRVMAEYEKIRLCEHYLEVIENASYADKNNRSVCVEQLRQYLKRTDYRHKLSCNRSLKKAAFRKRLVCGALRLTGITGALFTNRLMRMIETNAGRIQWIVRMERRSKLKGSCDDTVI